MTGLRFLVVEDHGFQRWLICDLLEQLGAHAVYPVPEGRAALELLDELEGRVDVIVSDLDMPGVDGMELIRHLAERKEQVGLIVVSALEPALLATVETMAREYGVNLVATIAKPLTARKVEAAIALFRPDGQRGGGSGPALTAAEIEEALRSDQFEAYYQPIAEIRTGRIHGAEALARWPHPDRGFVPPGTFMPIVEAAGLVDALTRRIVEHALLNCRAWHGMGLDIGVSVNLSTISLSDATLADRLTTFAREAGLEPGHVTFEITESAAERNMGAELENLSRLRMKGFGLSIDDFGTGYSSMQRLSRIPFTELKIDQVFVRNMGRDATSAALVESSLELAAKLGIPAVAEGVETREEWEALLALGCPFAQGFYIARPMHSTDFLGWMESRNQGCA